MAKGLHLFAFIAAKLEKERSGKVAERDLRSVFIAAWGERPVSEITKTRRSGNHHHQKEHRTADGPRTAGPDQAVLRLGGRSGNLWPVHIAMRGAVRKEADRRVAVARPTPHRRRDIRVLASHRAHGLPDWFGLPHAAAHRASAERGRADFVAGSSGQHHRHPGIEDEGPRGQGARTSGAAIVGGAGGHRISAAHQERAVPVLP